MITRKIIFYIQAFVLTLLFFALNSNAATEASQKLDSLLTFNTFQANFSARIAADKSAESKQKGRFYLMKPNLLRWELTKPNHQIIIIDHQVMQIYDVDLMQLTRQPLSGAFNPSVLLNNTETLQHDFHIEMTHLSGANQAFKLTPKTSQQFKFVILGFDKKGQLSIMSLKNNLDQNNIFQFNKIKVNQAIRSNIFHLKLPHGVDTVDAGQVQ